MYVAQRGILFPGASGSQAAQRASPPWGSWETILTKDGERLAALLSRPAGAKALFLLLHGNADNISAYGFLAEALERRGYGLLAVSFRGYPGSTGSPSESGLMLDGLAAFDWLSTRSGRQPIIVLGRSLGTGVAVGLASERQVAALVLVSPYSSIAAVAQRAYWYLPVKALIKDSFRSDLLIERVSAPKLFLHGDADNVIPFDFGMELYALAPEPKTLVTLRGVGHNDVWTERAVDDVVSFADDVLNGK